MLSNINAQNQTQCIPTRTYKQKRTRSGPFSHAREAGLLGSILVCISHGLAGFLGSLGLRLGLVGIGFHDRLLGLFVGLDHGLVRVGVGFGDLLLGLGGCLGLVFRIGLGYFFVGVGDLLVGLVLSLGLL